MSKDVQIIFDPIDPARAQAMQAMLGHTVNIKADDALPPFFHQLYFWDPKPASQLGRDGHPKVGGLIPDMGLPRRMWAGGRLEFYTPLRAGQTAERRSLVEKAERKEGRAGPLAFVTLRHEIWQGGVHVLNDWQDLVYRQDVDANAPKPVPPQAPEDAEIYEEQAFNATLLFRYSALTFNGHRIHYDRDYARDIEGYDGLVVHGPLLAQHLMLMAEHALGGLQEFIFRATAPLMDFERATFCWDGQSGWARGPDGRQLMQASAK